LGTSARYHLFVVADFSSITSHAALTHFLFAHIIAEACDALTLVVIALGFCTRDTPLIAGAAQHR